MRASVEFGRQRWWASSVSQPVGHLKHEFNSFEELIMGGAAGGSASKASWCIYYFVLGVKMRKLGDYELIVWCELQLIWAVLRALALCRREISLFISVISVFLWDHDLVMSKPPFWHWCVCFVHLGSAGLSAFLTTPMDVLKTRLQVQGSHIRWGYITWTQVHRCPFNQRIAQLP